MFRTFLNAVRVVKAGETHLYQHRQHRSKIWETFLSGRLAHTQETPERQHCGHHTPDREEAQPKIEITEKGKTTKRFNLLQSNQATSNFGAEKANGMWTMVYDEGFDVQMSGYNFFAFSRFDLSWSNGVKKNISRCGETQVGWYSNVDKSSFGCFVAKKTGSELKASLGL